MGYDNVEIFEKEQFGGGILSQEIPMNRSPMEEVSWEIEMAKQIGVKVHYGKELGKDFTLQELREQGFDSIFLGIGLQDPNLAKNDHGYHSSIVKAQSQPNFFTSKEFLKNTNYNHKVGVDSREEMKLHGHVVVLGIGDTALDCARSAYRQGADRVTCVFRRGFQDIRCNDEIFDPARKEGVNFLPYSAPLEYSFGQDGELTGVQFDKYLPS